MQIKEESEPDNEALFLKAKSDALRLLSVRPRSVSELRERILKKRYSDEIAGRLIEVLKKQGFLDDEKFAKLVANASVYSRPQGKKKLLFDLKKKGLSESLVQRVVSNLQEYDEKKMAMDLVRSRFQKMTGVSKEKKKFRIYGFLKRRGFGEGVVFEVLKELFEGSGDVDNG